MTAAFARYVGIDWSGAAQRGYRGIAIAQCQPGVAAPVLVAPAAGNAWTRAAVLGWLQQQVPDARLLIGFDFAFALPGDGRPAPALWAEVDSRCAADADLLGRRYAEGDPRFWQRGPRPAHWQHARRATETACAAAGLGQPQSPFQLIGAKQVGKGALAGMRLLHRLRLAAAGSTAVWPFDVAAPDQDGRSICVEIYPRLFIRRAGFGNRKLRRVEDLNAALHALGSAGCDLAAVDDHQADALVSAAGLRQLATVPALWQAGSSAAEGWIFGVP